MLIPKCSLASFTLLASQICLSIALADTAQTINANEIKAPTEQKTEVKAADQLSFYGFIVPSASYSHHGVATYGRSNMSAPTEAQSQASHERSSFQVQQSRLGFKFEPTSDVQAQLEIDFMDNQKASPTTQVNPRLRMAKITYDITKDLHLFAGQDWDLFSPLNPFGYNFVGSNFRAGNAGFFRNQIGLHGNAFGFLGYALSVGQNYPNSTEKDTSGPDFENKPAFSAQISTQLNNKTKLGFSGIISGAGHYISTTSSGVSTAETVHKQASGVNFFADTNMGDVSLKLEAHHGTNLNNLNLLTISQADTATNTSLTETAGYASLQYRFTNQSIWATWGTAALENDEKITAATHGSKGIRQNTAVKVGIDQVLSGNFKMFLEATHFKTRYFNNTSEAFLYNFGFYIKI